MSIKASNKGIIKEDEIWTVYVHIIPKEISEYDYNKYYVGITSRPVKYRWNNGNHYKEQLFYKAIKKYGWDNIIHYIIATHLLEDEAKELEKTLINKLKCNIYKDKYGYNATDGGDGAYALGYIPSENARLKMSKNHCDDNGKKRIYQFDINGKYIKSYSSAIEASRLLGFKGHHFSKHIKNQELYRGYLWGYESDIELVDNIPILKYKYKEKIKKISCSKRIYQFDLNGNYIATYLNIKDAVNKTNVTYSVGEYIKRHKSFYGYLWGFDENITIVNNVPKLNYIYKRTIPKNCKPIYMFDSYGKFIKKYEMAMDASKENNINNEYITRAARIWNTSYGYYWRYENGIDFDKNGKPILKGDDKT